ncbi:MAG TPA: hypothetical protein VMD47_07135 [Candidatus Acidoferrales bacterium]|nr:hypothetical protein [Candidatus Acidoferrales bacterium]
MFIASLLLSAALDAAAPTQSAYLSTSPVQVAACSIDETPAVDLPFGSGLPESDPQTAISFVNTDQRPISSVVFEVSDGTHTSRIVDKGTFSTGIAINHSYATPEFGYALGGVNCKVQAVAFADGSTWQAQ